MRAPTNARAHTHTHAHTPSLTHTSTPSHTHLLLLRCDLKPTILPQGPCGPHELRCAGRMLCSSSALSAAQPCCCCHTRVIAVCVCVCVCVCACARARVGGWVGGWAGVLVRMGRRRKRMIAMRFRCACMRVCGRASMCTGPLCACARKACGTCRVRRANVHERRGRQLHAQAAKDLRESLAGKDQKQIGCLPARTRHRGRVYLAACRQGPDTDTDTDPHRGGGRAQAAGGPARRSWPASRPSLGARHRHIDGFVGTKTRPLE